MIRHVLVAAALVAVAPAARAQMVDQARCYAAAERLMEKQNGHPLTQSERAGLQTYLFRLLLAGQSPTATGTDYDDIRRYCATKPDPSPPPPPAGDDQPKPPQ
jgi:hypothetical protein